MPAANRLAAAASPYLLQHAGNPVHWQPWDEAALAQARRLDRPILLSIGYSSCHWCHVMAHESFEDEATARLMNQWFVNIKVDREERPDLDRLYQLAHQLLAQRGGGWPLTLFLTPDDLCPYFAGTYFPPAPRHGLPAFPELLEWMATAYRDERSAIRRQNGRLVAALAAPAGGGGTTAKALTDAPLAAFRRRLAVLYDPRHGGLGRAPKFPQAPLLAALLRHAAGHPADREGREMLRHTLTRMAAGGICDQLGGGFFRYAVDERWEIPHFEKMLYDNGQLLALYAEAARLCDEPLFRRTAEGIGGWLLGEMRDGAGGFHAALDADSGGREGGYYLWQEKELRQLAKEELAALADCYGLHGAANFEGAYHLHAERPCRDDPALAAALERLRELRGRRPPPGRDDKVLTAWNALAIRGLAVAGRLLGRGDFIAAADEALAFLRRELWRPGEPARLLASWRAGQAALPAYLDDHALLLDAVLELWRARADDSGLAAAVALAEELLERFEDREGGGFFFTAADCEAPLLRLKPWSDEAIPAGNGVAARALLRLGRLIGEPRYVEAAERTLRAGWTALAEAPEYHGALLEALAEWLEPKG